MIDLLLSIGVSNLCLSLAFALVACTVQMCGKHPFLAHLLWLLVLVKLVTPPFVTIPVIAVPGSLEVSAETLADRAGPETPVLATPELVAGLQEAAGGPSAVDHAKSGLILLWLLGSACVLAWSLVRVYRFHRLLGMASEAAPPELRLVASELAQRLGLAKAPAVHTTSARLSPMVWWVGGRVQVVIPARLLREMDAAQVRWILAHELAHVRRRDHMVRWLEWLACVSFWWNPVAWWARRNLRANEEVCCDALVLESLRPEPHTYANSLLRVIEVIASPALRPPAMASEINSGGFLERRFTMIMSDSIPKTRRWLRASVLLLTLGLLPLGVAYAQDPDYDAVGRRLRAAVVAGELTGEQARAMLEALRKAAGANKEKQGSERVKVYLAGVKKRLAIAIKAGMISKEDAAKRYEGAVKSIKARMAGDRRSDKRADARQDRRPAPTSEWLLKVRKELGAAVRAGKISREAAEKRYAAAEKAAKERMAAGRREHGAKRVTQEDLRRAVAEIRKAVAAGEVSAKDARTRLAEMRKEMFGKQTDRKREDERVVKYRAIEKKIRAAVEAGELSKEDAERKLIALRQEMFGKQTDRKREDERVVKYRAIEKKIRAAVEAGELSKEDAERKLIALRKRMFGGERSRSERDAGEGGDIEARIRRHLEGAVQAGKMTEEEARKKFVELMKAYRARKKKDR